MKNLFFTVLFFLTTVSFGQSDSTSVSFVAYWSIGDSYDFKVTKINQQWKKGEQTKNEKQEYIANFTVIDSTKNSYTIKWTYENDFGNTYNIPDKLKEKFSKYKLTEVKYKTSELGTFEEIINWREIGSLMNKMFDDIIVFYGDNDKEKQKTFKEAMQPMRKIFSSKQGVEELIMKELQYIHFPMGLEFEASEPIIYEDEIPNLLGGNPIKADSKLYFQTIDNDEGFCILKQEMSLNPEDTKEMVKDMFSKMNLNDESMQKALASSVYTITDNNTFEFYFNPGIPHRIETIRETNVNIDNEKGRRIDKTIIELLYNEEND